MMRSIVTLLLLSGVLGLPSAVAQDACNPGVYCDCGSIWHREKLTDDWCGLRPCLDQHGLSLNTEVTQFYQGVTSGGANETFRYGGKADYFLQYSGAKAGLSGLGQGLLIDIHGETRFGDDINQDAVALAPSNVNMLYPNANQVTAITGLQITQALSEEWAVTVGKLNALDLFQMLYPQSGRGIDGFMNASMVLPLNLGRTVPLSFLGAGVFKLNPRGVQGALLFYDSNNITTTAGFDDLFDNGVNTLGLWRFFTDLGGRPGSHAFLGTYATGDFTSLDPLDWAYYPGQGIVAEKTSGSWSATYIMEQQFWADPCRPSRNLGMLAALGFGAGENNPFQSTFHIKCEGEGLLCGRHGDRMGVGYFYSGLSGSFKDLLSGFSVNDLQGGEIYYNAEITPWFHLTADLQVVQPGLAANDTATVAGLRANIDF